MDRYEQFRNAAIDKGIPEEEVGRFAGHLRFAIRAVAKKDGDQVVGRMGGLPRLPVGVEWPGNGYPLPFIGSVDCAALPRAEKLGLPEDGTLMFFLHHEEDMDACSPDSGYARVLYVPAGTETEVAAAPDGHDTMTHFCDNIPFIQPEFEITAYVGPDLPEWIEDRDVDWEPESVKQEFALLKHVDELCAVVEELWPSRGYYSTFRFGGYCSNVGSSDDPWTQMAYDNLRDALAATPDMPREEQTRVTDEEEARLIREWVTLAQFPTQSDVYYGCFLMSAEDLAAKRFDRARSFTMFTE
ncbi:Uncharacterized protein YwqG [Lentzea fradiae]|uniref:Uncharacterized protein YwqG n=1 Tax=Lentzea fradiae TaxID=200378 RepID=A0A1G7R1I9_9PSEU|nr:DUF1963 domain-containing protein [Lentzea fradiae]SDG04671.1 Uncharacterized protein YwqG [Lentzea fradiae]